MEFNQLSPLQLSELGERNHWRPGSGDWAAVQAVIDQREPVQIIQEAGSTAWQTQLPQDHPFYFGFPDFPPDPALPVPPTPKARIWISPMQRRFAEVSDCPKVQWHPPVLWVGVGYNRSILPSQIETAITEVCQAFHLATAAIAGLATLDRKLTDTGLRELCGRNDWLLQGFSAEQLEQCATETPSKTVAAQVGTLSVAEAAAVLAAQPTTEQIRSADVIWTEPRLRVRKQVVRFVDPPGAVTVAIAEVM
jgi:cobalt-precorrin 5A hydrolase / precorrin-3B C17-methyltransferase